MKRLMVWGLVLGLAGAGSLVADAKEHGGKEHGGKEHGGTAVSDSRPPELSKRDKTPKGLEKKNKTPSGWSKGKKKGWKKSQ